MPTLPLRGMTFDLLQILNRETELTVTLHESYEIVTEDHEGPVGQLMLIGLSPGTLVPLLNALKSYLEYRPRLTLELRDAAGRTLKLTEERMRPMQLEQTLEEAKRFSRGPGND